MKAHVNTHVRRQSIAVKELKAIHLFVTSSGL